MFKEVLFKLLIILQDFVIFVTRKWINYLKNSNIVEPKERIKIKFQN